MAMQRFQRRQPSRSVVLALAAMVALGGLIGSPPIVVAEEAAVVVDPPLTISVRPVGEQVVRGRLTGSDTRGFDLLVAEEESRRIAWAALEPAHVLLTHQKLLGRDDARGWFEVAAMLYPREGGGTAAETALRRALVADPRLKDNAQRLRNGEAVSWDTPAPGSDAPAPGNDAPGSDSEGGDSGGGDSGGGDTGGGGGGSGGPVSVGDVQSRYWGTLDPQLMADSVAELKTRMAEAQQRLGLRLGLYEEASRYFLFYTDLPAREARQWAGLLDQMYDRLLDIFGIQRGTNLFRGRCLIVVFRQEMDYHRYHRDISGINSVGTAGLCRSYGNGHAEVTFYKQANELNFARILVHESVHAFIHRYRAPPRVVSWINEGLAEYVAAALVEDKGYGQSDFAGSIDRGKRELRRRGSLGGHSFFTADHIQAWQYPVAQMLCDYMIAQDRLRYRAFINAIKDGKPWQQALEEDYGVTVPRLVAGFGAALGLRDLQP